VNNCNYPIVIQARSSSSRLPQKVLQPFANNLSMIEFQFIRLSSFFSQVVVATSNNDSDDSLYNFCASRSIPCYRGSLDDVMGRLLSAVESLSNSPTRKSFVRVGGDDPFISPEGIQVVIDQHASNPTSAMTYSSYDGGMPYGCACECFTIDGFTSIYKRAKSHPQSQLLLEHTKPAFIGPYELASGLELEINRALIPETMKSTSLCLSVDYPVDFLLASYVASNLVQKFGIKYSHDQLMQIWSDLSSYVTSINSTLHSGFGE
jgi:spore coat polysaccharide biosynthesis protein SpsF